MNGRGILLWGEVPDWITKGEALAISNHLSLCPRCPCDEQSPCHSDWWLPPLSIAYTDRLYSDCPMSFETKATSKQTNRQILSSLFLVGYLVKETGNIIKTETWYQKVGLLP